MVLYQYHALYLYCGNTLNELKFAELLTIPILRKFFAIFRPRADCPSRRLLLVKKAQTFQFIKYLFLALLLFNPPHVIQNA